jgi:hypothetical protein
VEAGIRQLVVAVGRGVTTRELEDARPDLGRGPDEPTLGDDASYLLRKGRLLRVGTRAGQGAYVPADAPAEVRHAGVTPEADVARALAEAEAALGRPVRTSEVHARRTPDAKHDSHAGIAATRNLLMRLCDPEFCPRGAVLASRLEYREPGRGVAVLWATPRYAATATPGAPQALSVAPGAGWHWTRPFDRSPAHLASLPPIVEEPWGPGLVSKRQCFIALVEHTRAAMRVPPLRTDVMWWARAHAHHRVHGPLVAVANVHLEFSKATTVYVATTARRPKHKAYDGLSVHRTPLTVTLSALAAPRVGLEPFTERERLVAHALDTFLTRTPGAEWTAVHEAGIDLALDPTRPAGSPALTCLFAARRLALAQTLVAVAPLPRWSELLRDCRAVYAARAGWLVAGRIDGRQAETSRRRLVDDLQQEIAAIREALRDLEVRRAADIVARTPIRIVGAESGIAMADRRWLLDWNPARGSRMNRLARRVPNAEDLLATRPNGPAFLSDTTGIDRVDMLVLAAEESAGPNAEVLVSDAASLLGRTLRDHHVVRDAEAMARASGDWDTARALLVARGLLGDALDAVPLLRDAREGDDREAAVLALFLAGPSRARDVFAESLPHLPDSATAAAVVRAIRALDADEPFGVIDTE